MHRIQFKKKKKRFKDFCLLSFSLSLSLSLLDVWEDMWVQTDKSEIAQSYQCMMADKLSASR
jgi:hypothetical protein